MKPRTFERFMTYAATLVLAAMTRRSQMLAMPAGGMQPAASQGGLKAAIIDAFIKGITDALKRSFTPRRRRSSSTYGRKKKHSSTRRRTRSRTPSLNDILGDIVKDAFKSKPRR